MATKLEDMSYDELVAAQQENKAKMDAIREDSRKNKEVLDAKILQQHIDEAKKQMQILADKNGRTLEEEAEYWQGRLTENGDPGRWVQSNLVLGKPGKVIVR